MNVYISSTYFSCPSFTSTSISIHCKSVDYTSPFGLPYSVPTSFMDFRRQLNLERHHGPSYHPTSSSGSWVSSPSHYDARSGRAIEYAESNVTGYRRCLEVPGLPGRTFFDNQVPSGGTGSAVSTLYSNRGSRAIEHRGRRKTREDDFDPFMQDVDLVSKSKTNSLAGWEIVQSGGDGWYGDDDDADTLVPEDSISHVSSKRPSKRSGYSDCSYQSGRYQGCDAYGGESRALIKHRGTQVGYEDARSTFQSHRGTCRDPGYDVIVREPRWVVRGRA